MDWSRRRWARRRQKPVTALEIYLNFGNRKIPIRDFKIKKWVVKGGGGSIQNASSSSQFESFAEFRNVADLVHRGSASLSGDETRRGSGTAPVPFSSVQFLFK
jgi:hypothetical protein